MYTLYASAAKSNYTTSIAHFLSTIAAYPQLKKKLHHCGAFKISNKDARHICFGFDEALEIFVSQDERERIDLLISEYLDNHSISHGERTIELRKESLWKLVNDLVTVFGMADPSSHQLFQEYPPTEMHKDGLDHLIACYSVGLEQIKSEVAENSNKRQLDLDELSTHDTIEPQIKKRKTGTKRQTTKDEMEILFALKVYKNKLSDDAIATVCKQLLEI
ncbi:hypothetical protein Glove_142g54 [Diversispora epigaea]|uniref:Uncharacterized protein n=1 Tax=Diversispora epigaea TaxID=1348612 RepID=A0A397IYJ1_9GLOM|nr:hypothetical protein Glove_142g54 [Diversispora epigaea]